MDLQTVHAGVHTRKLKKRVGRGIGSGHGKTATRGVKGQYASAGAEMFGQWYEGGQMPIVRRSPKRGFSNASWATKYQVVNVGDIDAAFDNGGTVNLETLKDKKVLRGKEEHFRVLGTGEVTKKLDVTAHHFSASAKEKIEKAGGSISLIPGPKKPVRNKMGSRVKAIAAKNQARIAARPPKVEAPPVPTKKADKKKSKGDSKKKK